MHALATQPLGNLVLGEKPVVFTITPCSQRLAMFLRILHLLFFLVRKRRVGRKTGEDEIVGREFVRTDRQRNSFESHQDIVKRAKKTIAGHTRTRLVHGRYQRRFRRRRGRTVVYAES